MERKRAVLVGMMSEICIKGRIVLDKVRKGDSSPEEAEFKLERLEAEMERCVRKMEKLS